MKIRIDDFCENWVESLIEEAFSHVQLPGVNLEAYAWIMDHEAIDIEVTYQVAPLDDDSLAKSGSSQENMKSRNFRLKYWLVEQTGKEVVSCGSK